MQAYYALSDVEPRCFPRGTDWRPGGKREDHVKDADVDAVFRHQLVLSADTFILEINSAIHLQFRQAHEGHKVSVDSPIFEGICSSK